MKQTNASTIDEYIALFPEEIREVLEKIRATVRSAAPDAVESISYAMPAFSLNKRPLVYFAAFKNHIGFYALPEGNDAFKEELSAYKTGKGSIQFPLDEAMPFDLIIKIVKFRAEENTKRTNAKPKSNHTKKAQL